MAGLFCLSSGVLLRRHLRPGDLLVADRSFWSFALLAFRPLRGTDLLVRGRYAARIDWRKGRRFGRDDRFITLKRSADKDASRIMSPAFGKGGPSHRPVPTFAPSPSCASPPCSTPSSNPWPPSPPFDPRRWRVELYFNDLKTTRQASRRRGLTPGLVRRELLLQSASQHAAPLDQLRGKGTLATVAPEARLRVEIVGAASETRASRTRKARARSA